MGNSRCTTLSTTNTEIAANKALTNDILAKLLGSYPVTKTGLAIGSPKASVANSALDYTIAGVRYSKVAAVTAPGNDVVPQATYGAVAFDIGIDGTIDAVEAEDNATGYVTAALAIAGIPAAASDHARLGTVTATKSDGAFTFGTTDLDAANTTVAYTDGETNIEAIGSAIA